MDYDPKSFEQFKLRDVDRVRVQLNASLAFDGAAGLPVIITNVSTSGFCCNSEERLAIGTNVIVHIPGHGQFDATIVWQLGEQAGGQFETPLSLPAVMAIILTDVQGQPEPE